MAPRFFGQMDPLRVAIASSRNRAVFCECRGADKLARPRWKKRTFNACSGSGDQQDRGFRAHTHTHTLTCIIYVAIPSFFDLYSIYILYIISVYMCVCMFILLILFWGVLLA